MNSRLLRRSGALGATLGLLLIGVAGALPGSALARSAAPWMENDRPIQERVDALLAQMNVNEKVGQMVQINTDFKLDDAWMREALITDGAGSLLSGGGNVPSPNIPSSWASNINKIQKYAVENSRLHIPVIYGYDAVHGNNNVLGAEIFPHQIGLGATADTALVTKSASATAKGAKAMGIGWTFAPVLEVSRDARYGRYYESFGEDPILDSVLGAAAITGFQGNDPSHPIIAATDKHFAAYSQPIAGHDRTMAQIPLRYLQETFLRPFKAGVDAGVATAMANSASLNNIPVHASHYMLTDVLRGQMGFGGVVISDWQDVFALKDSYHVAATEQDAIRIAVMAGVDISMCQDLNFGTRFVNGLLADVNSGAVPMSRIDQAVRRILTLKFQLGLFDFDEESSYPKVDPQEADATVLNNPMDVALARQAADESMTLLKNATVKGQPALPLSKSNNIVVSSTSIKAVPWGGNPEPIAKNLADQVGGWTLGWQGAAGGGEGCCTQPTSDPSNGNHLPGQTVFQGLQSAVQGQGGTVTWADPAGAPAAAASADAAIVVVGEPPYAEGVGDTESNALAADQTDLVQKVAAANPRTIVVVIAGRPKIMNEAIAAAGGLLMAYLPGSEGGNAVADVLFGDVNPSGRLPVSWARNVGDEPFFYQYLPGTNSGSDGTIAFFFACCGFGSGGYDPVFPFGFGLSYTSFTYSNLHAVNSGGRNGTIQATVDVTNSGSKAGDNIVYAYAAQPVSAVLVPPKRLANFARVHLNAGETKTVTLTFSTRNLSVVEGDVDASGPLTVEPGAYQLMVDNQTANFSIP
jgi:beta-glucosidase